jgi:hypothetical protein
MRPWYYTVFGAELFRDCSVLATGPSSVSTVFPLEERHFRRTVAEYGEHYHRERHHQGLANELIDPSRADVSVASIDVRASAAS